MGSVSSKDDDGGLANRQPERSYTEEEFLKTFQRSYDYFEQTSDDSESGREPYFCMKDWYLCSKGDNDETIELPDVAEMTMTADTILKGWVYPAPGSSLIPVYVIVHNLSSIVIDRTREYRGYWMMRQPATSDDSDYGNDSAPIYWLHQPSADRYDDFKTLATYRGGLAIISNLIDLVFDRDDGASYTKKKATQVAELLPDTFDLDLLHDFRGFALQYLLGSIPGLTKSCAFIKSLTAGIKPTDKNRLMTETELLAKIVQAEQRSHQHPWGEPLGELLLADDEGAVMADCETSIGDQNGHDDCNNDDDGFDSITSAVDTGPVRNSGKRQASPRLTKQASSSKRQRAARSAVKSYRLDSSEDELDDMSSEDDTSMAGDAKTTKTLPTKRDRRRVTSLKKTSSKSDFGKAPVVSRKRPSKPLSKAGKKKATAESSSDESEDFVPADNGIVEHDDDDSLEMDEVSSDSEKGKMQRGKGGKKTASAKVKSEPKAWAKDVAPKDLGIDAKNVPHYKDLSLDEIAKTKEFIDPCGMEATDDIIDRLVGAQVDKIADLLERSLTQEGNFGSVSCPLTLGTACSGTDAPALALSLVKEQLNLRSKGDMFAFKHEFSCEKEPFKQAYLARNFDSILYPDITRMTDDKPQDVYGQLQPVPEMNLFVAGTSCKNFSMLRTKWRIDIEDKGCSGETFLAAVEILYKEKPAMSIFENVLNAPWQKMAEYISGRVRLNEIDKRKNISDDKDKGAKLTFIRSNGRIVVDKVPGIYGVRCGAVVKGFVRDDSGEIEKTRWPSGNKCTLEDLMKANSISKENGILVLETPCVFCTQLVKVDTKKYGLPQTRERTYMFVWRPNDDDINDDLGQYWARIVRFLEAPAKHSITAFMLEDDHPDVRRYREALNGPAGRQSKRETFQESDFYQGSSGDLKYNLGTRAAYGIDRQARFLTNWNSYGRKQVAPKVWLPWLNCKGSRIVDFLDILYGSAVRDAECHDPLYSSFSWNVSQNAGRESHRTAKPGIAGCLTPGGDFFIPHRGRPLLGSERLLAQGIPYFRLMLGNESNVQLGDLAGNAMSLTVVCATMLAAITCHQLRSDTINGKQTADVILADSKRDWLSKKSAFMTAVGSSPNCSLPFFRQLAELSVDAVRSSVLCICETSGGVSNSFVQCNICRVSCCRTCISDHAGPNLSYHKVSDVDVTTKDHDPVPFQEKLRKIAPTALCFSKESLADIVSVNDDMYRAGALSDIVFTLHRIKRDTRRWLLLYYARDNHGIGEAVAEIRLTVGEIETQSNTSATKVGVGVKAELTSFLPALTAPIVFGKIDPCAKLELFKEEVSSLIAWTIRDADENIPLLVEGRGTTASLRVEVGLADDVAGKLKTTASKSLNKKHFANAKLREEERRWIYADNWKDWPETISIKAIANDSTSCNIAGDYIRAQCRQTTNQSALWVRAAASASSPSLYIIIRPNVNRTGPDIAVVSSSLDSADSSAVLAAFPRKWQPCDALKGRMELQFNFARWTTSSTTKLCLVESNVSVKSPKNLQDVLVRVTGLSELQVTMLCQGAERTSTNSVVTLQVDAGQRAQQIVRAFNSTCASAILTLSSRSGLKYSVAANAAFIDITEDDTFGLQDSIVPFRPTEEWTHNAERNCMERTCQPGAAREYVLRLQKAKKPFEFLLDVASRVLDVKCYPNVAAHHAAAHLLRGRQLDDAVKVAFKLSDASQQLDPECKPFVVHNSHHENATNVSLNGEYALYPRQQKVVTKMLAIESRQTYFDEMELSEFEMPGSTGFSLMGKATRTCAIDGGVIADAIGAGKTVISIALILQGAEKARQLRMAPRTSSASLVVVPPGLIDQWGTEVNKFAPSLVVLKVYDAQSLASISVGQILQADIVICPIDILESAGYLKSLIRLSSIKLLEEHTPSLPQYSGQAEQTAATGIWIPHSSQDPYGGGNNPRSQRRRDDSAFYTYIYSKAISELREQQFGEKDKAIPLEYFEWERVIIDEIHESLCTTKVEIERSNATFKDSFKERNRRAGRELLGITTKDVNKRPLAFRGSMLGLTGTPLLDSSYRVTELANLMGGTYVTGLSSHWRKLEKESGRDIFLSSYLEPKQSREVRKMIDERCQEYLNVACCRNKAEEAMDGIRLVQRRRTIHMTTKEEVLYLSSQSGIEEAKRHLSISPKDFDASRGADVGHLLHQNAAMESRQKELVSVCSEILSADPHTKIIVFADSCIGAAKAASTALKAGGAGIGCTCLEPGDSVQEMNRKISYYQQADVTDEDKSRPRVLVLSFENAAGLNLQTESYNVVLYHPLYSGSGGSSDDPVQDVSVELQAIGRVFRNGQTRQEVYVYRIEVLGPNGEPCLDTQLLLRNGDDNTIAMATNADD